MNITKLFKFSASLLSIALLSTSTAMADEVATVEFSCTVQYTAGTIRQTYHPSPYKRTCSANLAVHRNPQYIPVKHIPISCVVPAGQTSCSGKVSTGLRFSQISEIRSYSTPSLTSYESALACNYAWGAPVSQIYKLTRIPGNESTAYYGMSILSELTCAGLPSPS